jgi:hypothetical protein
MTWDARIKQEASGFQRRCSACNEMLALAAYLAGCTRERVTAPSRRSSLDMSSFFAYAVGFIAWAVIPALRGWL